MHCVIWTWQVAPGAAQDAAAGLLRSAADRCAGATGLVRAQYGYAEDGGTVIGIHLWQSAAAADAFHDGSWLAESTERFGSLPARQVWTMPAEFEVGPWTVRRGEALRAPGRIGPEDEDRRVKPGEAGANDD